MANTNDCVVCNELREEAPEFVVNGVTDTVCNNLQNDKGMSGNSTDCEELADANDCLIGTMEGEIEKYDVCDWKDYMEKFVPNVHEVVAAVICAICGLWTNIHNLWKAIADIWTEITNIKNDIDDMDDRMDDMCKLINSNIAPPLSSYGVHPLSTSADIGTAVTSKIRYHADDGTLNPYTKAAQGIGISYGRLETTDCVTGKCTVYEWIQPQIFMTYIKEGVEEGEVLWYARKSQLQAASGFTDHLWRVFTESSWTWSDAEISNGSSRGKGVELKITVNPGNMGNDYIGVVYRGTTYPNESTVSYDFYPGALGNVPRLYTHTCGAK